MQTRVRDTSTDKPYWRNKPLMSREDFYEWALENDQFKALFQRYLDHGCPRKLAPSVDRIDPERGYVIGNVQWLTQSENSKKGTNTRDKKLYRKPLLLIEFRIVIGDRGSLS